MLHLCSYSLSYYYCYPFDRNERSVHWIDACRRGLYHFHTNESENLLQSSLHSRRSNEYNHRRDNIHRDCRNSIEKKKKTHNRDKSLFFTFRWFRLSFALGDFFYYLTDKIGRFLLLSSRNLPMVIRRLYPRRYQSTRARNEDVIIHSDDCRDRSPYHMVCLNSIEK